MPDFTAQAPALVNTTTAGNQDPAFIAGLANGGTVVTWWSAADQSVYAQQYSASGAPVGGETLVPNATSLDGVTGVAGGFVVLFTQGGVGSASSVQTQRVDFSGHAVGGAVVVASSTNGSIPVAGADIDALPDGGWLVTFEREYMPPSPIFSASLSGQRFDASGSAVGGELALAQPSGSLTTSTAVLPDGEWVTTFNQFVNYHDGLVAYATQFAANGAIERVTTINPNDATEVAPQVARLAGGQEVVVWFTPDQQATAFHLQAQLFDATGAPLAAAFDLADAQGVLVGKAPQVTALADGGFLVSWVHAELVSQASSGPSTYSFDVRAQSFDSGGRASGAPVQLEPARTVNGYLPPAFHWSVVATGDGGFVAAEERTSATTGLDVYIQKFSPAPAAGAAPGSTTVHTGTAGDDRLAGSTGNDSFDGGAGTDTALLGIALADVQSYSTSDGVLTIAATGGTDTLRNIERVQFTDALFALDTQPGGHVWEAAALWHLAFGVLPGRADLSQWTAAADHSAGMGALATLMIAQYAPGIASADLVTFLYQQLVHEQPTPATVQSYVDQIGAGRTFATQGDLVAYAAGLPLNTDALAPVVGSIQQLDPAWF